MIKHILTFRQMIRSAKLRPGKVFIWRRRANLEALLIYMSGRIAPKPCTTCQGSNGVFDGCITASVDGITRACSNCEYSYRHAQCSVGQGGPKQAKTVKPVMPSAALFREKRKAPTPAASVGPPVEPPAKKQKTAVEARNTAAGAIAADAGGGAGQAQIFHLPAFTDEELGVAMRVTTALLNHITQEVLQRQR
jgi:hypothetical protein